MRLGKYGPSEGPSRNKFALKNISFWSFTLQADEKPLPSIISPKSKIGSPESIFPYVLTSCVYFFASWITRPLYQGDTADYVASILEHTRGGYYNFWDFGHLLWRPFGLLAYRVSGSLPGIFAGSDPRVQITLVLTVLSWIAGLASALLLLAFIRLYCAPGWIPELVAIAFIFSTAELNYSRAGSAYIPGLAFLLLAMFLIAQESIHPRRKIAFQICAGLSLAASVSLWFPYVLAVPAAILLPFAWRGPDKARLRISIAALGIFGLGISLIYSAVAIHLGLWSAAGFMVWAGESSHGISIPGISRTIFGWPRSFVDMGEAGRIIKRYLLRDPFNPISGRDLVHLWPEFLIFGLFYLTLLTVFFNLVRFSRGRRTLTLEAIAVLPVLAFAMHWSGGDLERYLPLYPLFFLALSISLAGRNSPIWTKSIACTFLACVVLTNAVGLGTVAVRRSQMQSEDRVSELMPLLSDVSLVVVSHNLDDLMEFSRNFPFSPINSPRPLPVYPLVTPGNADVADWQTRFASRAVSVWRAGGTIWISNRLLHRTPRAEWNWVEGDVRRVSWTDLGPFFSHLQYGERVGGADGFALLLPSTENQNALGAVDTNETILLRSSAADNR